MTFPLPTINPITAYSITTTPRPTQHPSLPLHFSSRLNDKADLSTVRRQAEEESKNYIAQTLQIWGWHLKDLPAQILQVINLCTPTEEEMKAVEKHYQAEKAEYDSLPFLQKLRTAKPKKPAFGVSENELPKYLPIQYQGVETRMNALKALQISDSMGALILKHKGYRNGKRHMGYTITPLGKDILQRIYQQQAAKEAQKSTPASH